MRKLIRKILKESDFDWVGEIPEAGSLGGRPQGVVYIRSDEELLLFNELINKNKDVEGLTTEHLGDYLTILDNSTEFCGQTVISLSFFIQKDGKYNVGYWDCEVDEGTVDEWCENEDGDYRDDIFINTNPDTWTIFDNVEKLKPLF